MFCKKENRRKGTGQKKYRLCLKLLKGEGKSDNDQRFDSSDFSFISITTSLGYGQVNRSGSIVRHFV